MPEPLLTRDTLPADVAGVVAACGALPLPRLVEALRADQARESEHLAELTAYTTALVMTYVTKGKFIQP